MSRGKWITFVMIIPMKLILMPNPKWYALLPILEQHIAFLEDDEDIDLVLESFEHSVYQVKNRPFLMLMITEQLLDHLSEDGWKKLKIIRHGDLLIKNSFGIRNYEENG